jgi:signal transduction histidine kinase
MFETLQLLSLGVAAVADTVVLLALAERRNRRFVHVPLLLLLGGAWLWHGGLLALALSLSLPGAWAQPVQWLSLLSACAGLLLMPCAMGHALVRLWRTGLARLDYSIPWHGLAYLPLFALVPLAGQLELPPVENLLAPLLPYALPYLAWTSTVNIAAALTFLGLASHVEFPPARPFFVVLAGLFLVRTVLHLLVFLVFRAAWPAWEPYTLLAYILSPTASVLVFGWFVVRYNFLHVVVDRPLVYAGLALGLVLLHQLVFQDVSAELPGHYRAPLVFVEGAIVLALLFAAPPLRRRSAEALRCLLGEAVAQRRDKLRRLATDLSAQVGRPPGDLLSWFAVGLRSALEIDFAASWLFDADGTPSARCGDTERLDETAVRLYRGMSAASASVWTCTEAGECLQTAGASLAVLRAHRRVTGLILLGRHSRNRELAAEEVSAVLLLVEQLAITLDHSLLHAERLDAERRAALGLLASSLAHEIKNPLSAVKTIATVLAEELGPDSRHAEDVGLIRGEIDRLAATTVQILDFARPRARSDGPGCVGAVVAGTLRLLRHQARQRDIVLEARLAEELPRVSADEQALREIFFNLVSNSLESTGPGGRVVVVCAPADGCVLTEVSDSGPGLAPEVRERLFEPFQTTKAAGSGLGLYVVGRRVRELGGAIACRSEPGRGTTFTVRLPCVPLAG